MNVDGIIAHRGLGGDCGVLPWPATGDCPAAVAEGAMPLHAEARQQHRRRLPQHAAPRGQGHRSRRCVQRR